MKYAIHNTAKAIARELRYGLRIYVRLPFNDYLLRGSNKGKVFTGQMHVHRKPYVRDGRVFIRADCREFEVSAYVWRFTDRDGNPIKCRGVVLFETK